jgi:hypothetical protein
MKRLILIMVLMVLGSSGCGGGSRRSVFNLFGREDAPIDMSDLTTVEKTKLIERIHSMELKAKRAAASNKVALFFILAGVAGGFAWWRGSNLGFGVVLLSAVGCVDSGRPGAGDEPLDFNWCRWFIRCGDPGVRLEKFCG